MKLTSLLSLVLLPAAALAHKPTPLRAVDGRDLSFLLKRHDGPVPILRRASSGKRHTIVPRTLQVEEIPVRRGLVERQGCVDPGFVPCPDGTQCCPAGATCQPGGCCPAGNLSCTGNCCEALSGDCCPSVGCCPLGQKCFTALDGEVGCCPTGQTCTTISGCADTTATECPGENFCCPAGTTCGRDATGDAACVNGSGGTSPPETTSSSSNNNNNNNNNNSNTNTVNSPNTRTNTANNSNNTNTSSSSSNSNSNNSNSNNNNGNNNGSENNALPRVAGASGLMVAVAFMGALLI